MKLRILYFLLLFQFFASAARGAKNDLWILEASNANAPYVGAPMANGIIGILPWKEPFSVRQVTLNHVFDTDGPQGVSRVLKGLNPFLLSMQINGEEVEANSVTGWRQSIDMKEAVHSTFFTAGGKARICYQLRALRNMPYAGLIQVELTALSDISIKVSAQTGVPQEYVQPVTLFKEMRADDTPMRLLQSYACSRYKHQEVASSSSFIFGKQPPLALAYDGEAKAMHFTVNIKKGEKFSFGLVAAVCSSRDFSDPYNEAERQVIYAVHKGTETLVNEHRRLWKELWQGDIRIEGDDEAQRAVRFALFNLYSSCREESRLSIPPMGLSSQGYNGHVFWDSELWMFPPMLLLNQGIATSMLDYRIDRLPAARKKAMAYGYKGAMFPWESDDRGEEATPTTALTGPLEHHITADVAIACWNYYSLTRNKEWLRAKGFPLMKAVADFWVSRVSPNSDGTFSIRTVVGADEYANGVNDNAFTNAAAKQALEYACKAAEACGEKAPDSWKKVGTRIRILRFEDGVTREHATYNGQVIKQADANLLGYPLYCITDTAIQKKDMEYYAGKIDPKHGPAMSYSVFCVQYARMGEADRAYEMFRRCYRPNLRAPFGVMAETPTSQNPYFMTGAGGLLQAVINGFCGLQITDGGLVQLPSALPKHWKRVRITGVGPNRETYERVQTP